MRIDLRLLSFLALFLFHFPSYGVSLKLKKQVVVSMATGTIWLPDVIEGDVPDVLKEKLKSIAFVKNFEAVEDRVLLEPEIAQRLRGLVTAKGLTGVQWVLPQKMEFVLGTSSVGSLDEKHLKQLIEKRWGQLCSGCRFEWGRIFMSQNTDFLNGKRWWIEPIPKLPQKSFSYRIFWDEPKRKSSRALWVHGEVSILKRVLVARRHLQAQSALAKRDVELQYRRVTFAQDSTPSLDEVSQYVPRRTLRLGEVLWRGALEKEKKIKRGDRVKARISHGDWQVALHLMAQEDGALGDIIRLRNESSKKKIMGKVVAKGEVEIQ